MVSKACNLRAGHAPEHWTPFDPYHEEVKEPVGNLMLVEAEENDVDVVILVKDGSLIFDEIVAILLRISPPATKERPPGKLSV